MDESSLVCEGWAFLQSGRPLATIACWRIAEHTEGEREAAHQALSALESAGDLPKCARRPPRLRGPEGAEARARWNERLEGPELDLEGGASRAGLLELADAFGRLAALAPDDAAAWFNRAVCLAWLGVNAEAVACLGRVVELEAGPAFERAVEAGTLAELLRQGKGAEQLADELSFTRIFDFGPEATSATAAWDEVFALLGEFPEVRRMPAPRGPGVGDGAGAGASPAWIVFEWLDRPVSEARPAGDDLVARGIPAVLAHVFWDRASGVLRLSSPSASALEQVEELLAPRLPFGPKSARREAAPRPLAFLDADVWTMRLPPTVDPERLGETLRDWVEHYYEDEWIHRPRQGLGGLSPLSAAEAARRGDAALKARLMAVVAFREQLGERPSARAMYHGYPFDRLRRRLGLALEDANAVDLADLTCASAAELEAIVPAEGDSDDRLASAMISAARLRDDALTTRFASAWFPRVLGRGSEWLLRGVWPISGPDLIAVAAALVRCALASGGADAALEWIERARRVADGDAAAELGFWRGEVLARADRGHEAVSAFKSRLSLDPAELGAVTALRAAESLIDHGHIEQARPLLESALNNAELADLRGIARQARDLLERHGAGAV